MESLGVRAFVVVSLVLISSIHLRTHANEPEQNQASPLFRVLELDIGESVDVQLSDGSKATVKLLGVDEVHDPIRNAIRQAEVTVEVNGRKTTLAVGTYHLPKSFAGVQIDCTVTRGYMLNSKQDAWSLRKAARIRLWPADSPWVRPGTFMYPVKQRWFAAKTQLGNEPAWVGGGDSPAKKKVYYHESMDIGGAEGLIEVVSATEGLVISAGTSTIDPDRKMVPYGTKYDYVGVLDSRGWFVRYIHLKEIDPQIKPGRIISVGDRIGAIGKEGASGGWSHLHFAIKAKQPSGEWGVLAGYAFLWQSYLEKYKPEVLAVAQPHHFVSVGTPVLLDASKSWSASGKIASYEWMFQEGTVQSKQVERTYTQPGTYCEVLKVTDDRGNVSYDFASTLVVDPRKPEARPPTIHAAYAPTFGIKPGDLVTFKVRTFVTSASEKETWDFGDGSPKVQTQSDENATMLAENGYTATTHRYQSPGDFVVTVERTNQHGFQATGHLYVHVE